MPDPSQKRGDSAPYAPRGHTTGADWPAFRYGPKGEATIFASADAVPEGWEDHPGNFTPEGMHRKAEAKAKADALAERMRSLEEREAAVAAREKVLADKPAKLEMPRRLKPGDE